MKTLWTADYIRRERLTWQFRTGLHEKVDSDVRPFLRMENSAPWLKKMRKALLLSVRGVAGRANMGSSAYFRYEVEEEAGTITLKSLRRCAEAMECELIYGLRPRVRKTPSEVIWDEVFPHVEPTPSSRLSVLINDKLYDPLFRREMGWTRNTQADSDVIRLLRLQRRNR